MIDNSGINVLGYFRIDLILLLDTILLYSILKTNRLFLTKYWIPGSAEGALGPKSFVFAIVANNKPPWES